MSELNHEEYRTARMREALRATFDLCREADNKRREAELLFEKAVAELTVGLDRMDERAVSDPSIDFKARELFLPQLKTVLPELTQRLAAHAARERRNELEAFEREHGIGQDQPQELRVDASSWSGTGRPAVEFKKKRGRPPGKRR